MWYIKEIDNENISQALSFVQIYEPLCVNLVDGLLRLQKKFNETMPLVKKSKNEKDVFFIFFHDTEIVAVCGLDAQKTFLHCFPNATRASIKAFVNCSEKFFKTFSIRSIMGEKKISEVIEKYLVRNHNYTVKQLHSYFLFELSVQNFLKQKKFYADENLRCDTCNHLDIENLLPLQFGYEREEWERNSENEIFSRVYILNMLSEQILFKGSINGKIVSKAHTNACGVRCKQIGGVYTLPAYRGKHYAEVVLRFALRTLAEKTSSFVLFVKVKNIAAQKLYRRLGFTKIAAFQITAFNSRKDFASQQ